MKDDREPVMIAKKVIRCQEREFNQNPSAQKGVHD
jgi:hypothetical protein